MKITLGITTHGSLNYTKLTLYSLIESLSLDADIKMHIVVVDNASPDETVKWLTDTYQDNNYIKIIPLDKNYGCSKAFNTIFQEFDQNDDDLCILSNSDVVFTTGWLENLLTFYDSFPEAGLFSPTPMDNHPGVDTYKWFGDLTFANYIPKIDPDWERYASEHKQKHGHEVDEGINFNVCCITKDCRKSVGNFDENFIIGCYDDVDYTTRAEKAGYRILNCNSSVVFHFGGVCQSVYRQEHGHNSYQQINRRYFCQKYGVDLDTLGARCTRSCFWTPSKNGTNERLYI